MKLKVRYIEHDWSKLPEVSTELELAPQQCAFIIIDMENDFMSKEGMFDMKKANLEEANKIVSPIAAVAKSCRQKGVKVIYTQHTFRPDLSDMHRTWGEIYQKRRAPIGPGSPVGPKGKKVGYLIRGTWNTEIIPELTPESGDIIIDGKRTHTAFYHTDLEMILRTSGINTLFFSGTTTSVCVESTLRDAFHRDFRCILLNDCVWEKSPDLQKATEKVVMLHFGYVTGSREVLVALAKV